MKMNPIFFSRLVRRSWPLAFAAFLVLRLAAASPWPEVPSDLSPDPNVCWGKLPNGLRYAILPNHEPRDRVSLRLLVATGSLQERDDETGIAHFVEHMMFRGTRTHPGDQLNRLLESRGIGFGPDSNAFTGYNYTIYHLELPDAGADTLRLGLQTMREYAEEATIENKYLAAERGVILSEKATRMTPEYLLSASNLEFLWPDSRQARHFPIGTEAVIKNCTREQLAAFYDAWYRPERLAVIVVGDLSADEAEHLIREIFSPLQGRGAPRPDPVDIVPRQAAPPNVRVYLDPRQVGVTFGFEHPFPWPRQADTHARRVQLLHLSLALTMLQNRLTKYSHEREHTFVSPKAFVDYPVEGWADVILSGTSAQADWKRAAQDLEQEHRRAFLYGFNDEELRVAKAAFAEAYTQAVRSAASRPSDWLATQLASCLLNGAIFATPQGVQQDLAAAIESTTLADCRAAFRDAWTTQPPHVFVASNPDFKVSATEIGAVLNQSRQVRIAASASRAPAAFAYTNFGPAGRIVRDDHAADLDVRLAELSNGVRLNFKHTAFIADTVDIYVRVGTGKLSQPLDRPGLDLLANLALTTGGLRRHTIEEINDLMAGRSLAVSFGVAPDAFVFTGRCAPRDLQLCLQLITAYLTDAAYRPAALTDAHASFGSLYASLAASPGGPITRNAPRIIAGDDPRFGIPAPDLLFGRTMSELSDWLEPEFKHGAIEASVVGDVGWEEAAKAAASTLGALPSRPPPSADPAGAHVQPATPPKKPYVCLASPTARQGALAWFWLLPDANDIHRERCYILLSQLITERLRVRVREELGAAYSPSASLVTYDGFPGLSYLVIYVEIPPARAQEVTRLVDKEIGRLRSRRASEEEFQRIKQPLISARDEDLRTNNYWLCTVLRDAQQHPERLAAARSRQNDFDHISSREIQRLAKQALVPSHCFFFLSGPPVSSPNTLR